MDRGSWRDRGAWWATVYGVAKSRTRLSMRAHFPAKETEIQRS